MSAKRHRERMRQLGPVRVNWAVAWVLLYLVAFWGALLLVAF